MAPLPVASLDRQWGNARSVSTRIARSSLGDDKTKRSVCQPERKSLSDLRLFQHPQQPLVEKLVPGNDLPLGKDGVAAVEVGHKAAGLAHNDDSGGGVPGRKVALP